VQPGVLHKPTSLKFKNSAKNLKKPSKPSSVDLKQEGSQRKPRSRVDSGVKIQTVQTLPDVKDDPKEVIL